MKESFRWSFFQLRNSRAVQVGLCLILTMAILWFSYVQICSRASSNVSICVSPAMRTPSFVMGWRKPVLGSVGNFEPLHERSTNGPGEGGKPHKLRPDQASKAKASITKYGMNMECSDEISLDRSIPDLRFVECRRWNYPINLPNVSVVVVFHDEGFSSLMRTVHSVINRTPQQFLAEVLLMDDFSAEDDLKAKLESYIERWDGTVRLIRNTHREGLINTRSKGAREALGEVIVFLDAHCEVNKNWLPPLLAPIYENRKTMTVPVIDSIDSNTFEIRPVYSEGTHFKGIFEWGMLYKEKQLTAQDIDSRVYQSEPYKSPTHAGGLFAIDKKYFLELGAYDPGLLVWGGENFELSFKIWQCGGSIMWVPCSRVAHVYKSRMPYDFGTLASGVEGSVITINYKRVVETWMDSRYKEFFYTREPTAKALNMGNISEQLNLKRELRCKSFQWFMDNVAYDMKSDFPEPPPNLHWGTLKNAATQTCLDSLGKDAPTRITALACFNSSDQVVRLNNKGQLGMGERCVDADSFGLKLEFCKRGSVSGPWQYNERGKVLYHKLKIKCLAINSRTAQLALQTCDPVSTNQQWTFNEVHL